MAERHSSRLVGQRRATRVLLISPPWRLVNWPSLSVGVLKAHLNRIEIPTDGLHLHFDVAMQIGLARYQTIASGWELGEALYFGLYSPSEASDILARTARYASDNGHAWSPELASIDFMREVERATLNVIDRIDLSRYSLVGLSVGALQLGASLYLAQIIKQRNPSIRVVLGGGSVLGQPGATLLELVPAIDAVVDGEGEDALAALAGESNWDEQLLYRIPNVRYRRSNGAPGRTQAASMLNLSQAAVPDMDEFYAAARNAGYPPGDLVMPLEASRGCAWEHRKNDGQLHGCTFCGLYRNSPNFREKPVATIVDEIRSGVERSQATAVSFVDAYLPPGAAKGLLKNISEAALDVTLFCEMRCDLDDQIADLLARAATRQVQLGVEAFNTHVLGKMDKGRRMIDNVFSIKLCEEYGIPYQYNLISHFPGVSEEDLLKTIELLPLLRAFVPPAMADFYLDRGSRIYTDPSGYGIAAESFDRTPLPFFPAAFRNRPVSQFVAFEKHETEKVRKAWAEIESIINLWRMNYSEVREQGVSHLLSYRDLGNVIVVTDYRNGEPSILQLRGVLRSVLLACDRIVSGKELRRRVPELDEETLGLVLDQLRAYGLIVEEAEALLGLPVRARLPNGAPRIWGRG